MIQVVRPLGIASINDRPSFVMGGAPGDPVGGGLFGHKMPPPIDGQPVQMYPLPPTTGIPRHTLPVARTAPGSGSGSTGGSAGGTNDLHIPTGVAEGPLPIPSSSGSSGSSGSSAPGTDPLTAALVGLLSSGGASAAPYNASTDPATMAIDALTPQGTATSSASNPAAIVLVVAIAAAAGLWFYFKHKAHHGAK